MKREIVTLVMGDSEMSFEAEIRKPVKKRRMIKKPIKINYDAIVASMGLNPPEWQRVILDLRKYKESNPRIYRKVNAYISR